MATLVLARHGWRDVPIYVGCPVLHIVAFGAAKYLGFIAASSASEGTAADQIQATVALWTRLLIVHAKVALSVFHVNTRPTSRANLAPPVWQYGKVC